MSGRPDGLRVPAEYTRYYRDFYLPTNILFLY